MAGVDGVDGGASLAASLFKEFAKIEILFAFFGLSSGVLISSRVELLLAASKRRLFMLKK